MVTTLSLLPDPLEGQNRENSFVSAAAPTSVGLDKEGDSHPPLTLADLSAGQEDDILASLAGGMSSGDQ